MEGQTVVIVNPLLPLQENQEKTWKYKLKRFRQEPPWGAICMCSGCLAMLLTLLIMLIYNVKQFSMN